MMKIKCAEERRAFLSSSANPETAQGNGEQRDDDDDDEALSLRNLPLIHYESTQENEEHGTTTPLEAQDDFYFCSPSQESDMRAADEIFFRGRILPLRHSTISQNRFNSISRSESMDHYFSGELTISGRSSSVSSPQSSTSSGGSTAVDHKLAPCNQFHSHPSPSPRILRSRQQMIRNSNRNCVKKSLLSWNVFRLGLIAAPPEIEFRDLKTRCSGKSGGDRSNMSSSSSSSEYKKRVKKWDIVGGCKCSVDTVDGIISPEMAIIKRRASDGERRMREVDDSAAMNESLNHRTSEWLKQPSLQAFKAQRQLNVRLDSD